MGDGRGDFDSLIEDPNKTSKILKGRSLHVSRSGEVTVADSSR